MNNFKTKFSKAKYFILGFLTCVLIFSLVMSVSSWDGTRTANLVYRNVKVNIDGKAVTLTDLEGNAIEPVFIDDTLYVPLSPMARAFGKKSVYEGGTSRTIFITTPSYSANSSTEEIKLSDMPVESRSGDCQFSYKEDCRANSGDFVFDCVLMASFNNRQSIQDYNLDGQYKSIKGTIFVPYDDMSYIKEAGVQFYGDGKLLYGSGAITGETGYINFDINLNGVKILKIVFIGSAGNNSNRIVHVGLSNTILYRYK